jgi:NAD(P)-dependent dehydrogenase (short-subunit alcohol dehydrogenase family)
MRFAGTTVIITGAAGELDSVIAAALAAEGGVVRSMRSHPARSRPLGIGDRTPRRGPS